MQPTPILTNALASWMALQGYTAKTVTMPRSDIARITIELDMVTVTEDELNTILAETSIAEIIPTRDLILLIFVAWGIFLNRGILKPDPPKVAHWWIDNMRALSERRATQ